MRFTGLLALLLFLLIVFFAAPAASYAQTAKPQAAVADSKNGVAAQEDSPQTQRQSGNYASEVDRPIVLAQPLLDHGGDLVLRDFQRDETCYAMRTYVMAREDKNSDATNLVRYQKCLPGWKLDLREAIAPAKSGTKLRLTP